MKMCLKIRLTTLLVLGLTLSSASFLAAAPFTGIHPLQNSRFTIVAGGYFPDIHGEYSLDGVDGEDGTDIDFQDDAGLDDHQSMPAFNAVWRLSDKNRLQGEYFKLIQGRTETLTQTIDLPPFEFEAGVKAEFDMEIELTRIFYGHSFVKSEKAEFGAGLGLHYFDVETTLKGTATLDGVDILNVKRGIDDWAILPNIGIFGNYAFSSKWIVMGRLDWISANIGQYDGTLWNVEAAIEYQVFKSFGVGLAYRFLSFDLEVEDGWGDWDIDLGYEGPMLFISGSF